MEERIMSQSHDEKTIRGSHCTKASAWFPTVDWKLVSLCLTWYLTSVISTSSSKMILKRFTFPVTLCQIQFIMNIWYCVLSVFTVRKLDMMLSVYRHSRGGKSSGEGHGNLDFSYSISTKFRSPYYISDLQRSSSYNKSFSFLACFPKGTFPENLNSYDYSIIRNFFKPSALLLKATVPMGGFQFLGQLSNNKATSLVPVSIVHTIKALSPMATVLTYRFLFKRSFGVKTYVTLIPLIVGVMMSCTKPENASRNQNDPFYVGCFFAFISMLIFVSQNIFAKKFLTYETDQRELDDKSFAQTLDIKVSKSDFESRSSILPISMPVTPLYGNSSQSLNKMVKDSRKRLDKISVLFYCSVVGYCLTLPFYILSEFSNPVVSLKFIDVHIAGLIFVYGIAHFMQSIVAFQILGRISPINYSIANILKRIIVISFSIFIEGTLFSTFQYIGLLLTFSGLYAYDRWGIQRRK